jgi:hypothetical protein
MRKSLSLELKQELIRFRMGHTWKETKEKYQYLHDETWRPWWNNRDKILSMPILNIEEKKNLKKSKILEQKQRYKQAHPDKVISSLMREKHPLIVCCYHANGNFKRYKSRKKAVFIRIPEIN